MKQFAALVLALAVGSLGSVACQAPAATPEVRIETVTLAITGMTCAVNCPPRVRAALESVAGVESATVDYDTRTASVQMRSGTDPSALVAAVRKQGFGAAPR
jgi:copper chaperone CopZ